MGSCVHRKVAPRPQKRPELAEKMSKIASKRSRSALLRDPAGVTLATNHSCFNQMALSKVIRAQEGIPTSQSDSPATKVA